MPDDAPAPTDPAAPKPDDPPKPADPKPNDPPKDYKAEFEKAQAEARKWEERAKVNRDAAKERDELKRTSMTDLEKAVADAREEGRQSAIKEVAAELVDAKIEAAATGRIAPEQLAKVLAGIDRSAFLDEDGKVDAKKVADFVEALGPVAGAPDLGQGPRGDAGAADWNATIRNRMRR